MKIIQVGWRENFITFSSFPASQNNTVWKNRSMLMVQQVKLSEILLIWANLRVQIGCFSEFKLAEIGMISYVKIRILSVKCDLLGNCSHFHVSFSVLIGYVMLPSL